MSFIKSITLDKKSIDFLNFLMEELNIKNFSQVVRIAITYAMIYKEKTGEREQQSTDIAILKYQLDECQKCAAESTRTFIEINYILSGKWADKQKVAKLKEIL